MVGHAAWCPAPDVFHPHMDDSRPPRTRTQPPANTSEAATSAPGPAPTTTDRGANYDSLVQREADARELVRRWTDNHRKRSNLVKKLEAKLHASINAEQRRDYDHRLQKARARHQESRERLGRERARHEEAKRALAVPSSDSRDAHDTDEERADSDLDEVYHPASLTSSGRNTLQRRVFDPLTSSYVPPSRVPADIHDEHDEHDEYFLRAMTPPTPRIGGSPSPPSPPPQLVRSSGASFQVQSEEEPAPSDFPAPTESVLGKRPRIAYDYDTDDDDLNTRPCTSKEALERASGERDTSTERYLQKRIDVLENLIGDHLLKENKKLEDENRALSSELEDVKGRLLAAPNHRLDSALSTCLTGLDQILDVLMCPITRAMPTVPVVAGGHVFDKEALEKWVYDHHTHPITRTPLFQADIAPIPAVRSIVDIVDKSREGLQAAVRTWVRMEPRGSEARAARAGKVGSLNETLRDPE
jgi:hypothetical protein